MTKNIIFIFAAFCTLQARADVQPTEKDTVRCMFRYDDTELLQPLQPSYRSEERRVGKECRL